MNMNIVVNKITLITLTALALNACVVVSPDSSLAPRSRTSSYDTSGSLNNTRTQNTHYSTTVLSDNNYATASASSSGSRLSSSHWTDVALIRREAERLGREVAAGQITKVQAAQYLNRYRLNLVGGNVIDDSMYEVYQKAALDSQRGVITTEQSRAYVISALKGWQQRWQTMSSRPDNPAFTNFLMEVMVLSPLK